MSNFSDNEFDVWYGHNGRAPTYDVSLQLQTLRGLIKIGWDGAMRRLGLDAPPKVYKGRDSAADEQWYYLSTPKGFIVKQRRDDPVCGGVDDDICHVGLLESDAASIARDHNVIRAAKQPSPAPTDTNQREKP